MEPIKKMPCQWCASNEPHCHEVTEEPPRRERAKAQIERLAAFILAETTGPIEGEGAIDTAIRLLTEAKGNKAAATATIAILNADVADLVQRNGKWHELYRQARRQIDALKDECARIASENGRLRANVAILNADKVDPIAVGLAFVAVPGTEFAGLAEAMAKGARDGSTARETPTNGSAR